MESKSEEEEKTVLVGLRESKRKSKTKNDFESDGQREIDRYRAIELSTRCIALILRRLRIDRQLKTVKEDVMDLKMFMFTIER